MQYWLIKSEPDCYSIDDLKRDKKTSWSGVRNYQARNFIRTMKVGDLVLFYHSSTEPKAVVGLAQVVKAPYAEKDPDWSAVDVAFVEKFKSPVTLSQIKINPKLEGMPLTEQGSRLSIQPVSKEHFEIVKKSGSIS
ncbi:EVE domain-containing protein [Candidatus Parcubacteria bacterium]|nr:EVE domain-containing protein [Candidatus Parcubacteria bacterium]